MGNFNLDKADENYPFEQYTNEISLNRHPLFKLHLNINPSAYESSKELIDEVLKEVCGEEIAIYKLSKYKKINDDPSYSPVKKSHEALQQLNQALQQVSSIEEANSLLINVEDVNDRYYKYLLKAIEKNNFIQFQMAVQTQLTRAENDVKKFERIHNSAQVTLYFAENAPLATLKQFTERLEKKLFEKGIQSSTCSESDLPISSYVSFRQDKLPNGEYVSSEENTTTKLKEDAKNSLLYLGLRINSLINQSGLSKNIREILKNEVTRLETNHSFFSIGVMRKLVRIEAVLEQLLKKDFNGDEHFFKNKVVIDGKETSLQAVLNNPRHWFGSTPLYGKTTSWKNAYEALKMNPGINQKFNYNYLNMPLTTTRSQEKFDGFILQGMRVGRPLGNTTVKEGKEIIRDNDKFAKFSTVDYDPSKVSTWKAHISIAPQELGKAWNIIAPLLVEYNAHEFKVLRLSVAEAMKENLVLNEKDIAEMNRLTQGMQITIIPKEGDEERYNQLFTQIENALVAANITPGKVDDSDKSLGAYISIRNTGKERRAGLDAVSYNPENHPDLFLPIISDIQKSSSFKV